MLAFKKVRQFHTFNISWDKVIVCLFCTVQCTIVHNVFKTTCTQTDRQASRQTNTHTDRDTLTDRHTDTHTVRNILTDRHTQTEISQQTGTQTHTDIEIP